MPEKVGKEKIVREKGFLYFIGKSGFVEATPTKLNKEGKRKVVGKEKIVKEPGYMYFVGKEGFVERSVMGRKKKQE